MTKSIPYIYNKARNPFIQASIVFAGVVIACLGAKLLNWSGLIDIDSRFPWQASTAFLLFFAVFNSVANLAAKDLNKYRGKSMLCFLVLALASGAFAHLLSDSEAGAYKWIYFVMTFGYLVFLSIVGMIKGIVDFAENEDWTAPKKKNRNNTK